jgi:hypothetical protein
MWEVNMDAKLVFLGGTCGKNIWRKGFIERLMACGVDPKWLFDPVVPDWNEAAQAAEDKAKSEAKYMLYMLGDPMEEGNHTSFYSLLEATMGLYDAPERTMVVFDTTGMPKHAEKASLKACKDLRARFPMSYIFSNLEEAEDFLINTLL